MLTADNMINYVNRITPEYVAGLFDGEGCVSSSLNNHGNVRLRVTITQKSPYILQLIGIKFPGTLQKHNGKSSWYSLIWTGSMCVPILEYIKDHVVIKHALVENGIKLAQLFLYNAGYSGTMTELIKKEREGLMSKIMNINKSNRDTTSYDIPNSSVEVN